MIRLRLANTPKHLNHLFSVWMIIQKNEQAKKRQVDLIDLAMEALREHGLSKVYALNTKEGFVDSVIVDWY